MGLGDRASAPLKREALPSLALFAEGDMRRAYNLLETIVEGLPEGATIGEEQVAALCPVNAGFVMTGMRTSITTPHPP